MGVNNCDLGVGNGFLNITPKAKMKKEKIFKLYFTRIINICILKDTIKNVQRP